MKFIRKNGRVIPIRDKGAKKPNALSMTFSNGKKISTGTRALNGLKQGAAYGSVFGGLIGAQMGVAGAAIGAVSGAALLGATVAGAEAAFGQKREINVKIRAVRKR